MSGAIVSITLHVWELPGQHCIILVAGQKLLLHQWHLLSLLPVLLLPLVLLCNLYARSQIELLAGLLRDAGVPIVRAAWRPCRVC